MANVLSVVAGYFSDPFVQDLGSVRDDQQSARNTRLMSLPNSLRSEIPQPRQTKPDKYPYGTAAVSFQPSHVAADHVFASTRQSRPAIALTAKPGHSSTDASIFPSGQIHPNNAQNFKKPPPINKNPFSAVSRRFPPSQLGVKDKLSPVQPHPIISSKLVSGTPKHFKQIIIGRCWEYQARIGLKERDKIDCTNVWNNFLTAFAYKDPCEVTTADYNVFLEKIEEDIPRDQALLWSGCRELAHKLSDFKYSRRFTTLEDTLAGYLFTGLTWCGSKQYPGINYTSCPYDCSIQAPFWAVANFKFAQRLQGIVTVLLNGTREHIADKNIYPSYMKDRYYFGPYVIPNLYVEKVRELRIFVAHTLRLRPLESCGQASIQVLQEEVKTMGIKVTCHDDPDIVKHILCVDEPMLGQCRIGGK